MSEEASTHERKKSLLEKKLEMKLRDIDEIMRKLLEKGVEYPDIIKTIIDMTRSAGAPLSVIREIIVSNVAAAYGVPGDGVKLVITLYDTREGGNDVSFIYSVRNPLNDTVEYGEGVAVFNGSYKLVRLVLKPKKAVED